MEVKIAWRDYETVKQTANRKLQSTVTTLEKQRIKSAKITPMGSNNLVKKQVPTKN